MTSGSARFPYHQVADDLRSAVADGRLAPGARLGSEWELAERYGTSRPTVRRAIALLKAEGLIVAEQGLRPRQHLLDVDEIPADLRLAEWLGLELGSPVVVRRRLFLADELPVALCDSCFDARLVRDTPAAKPRLVRGGASALDLLHRR